MPPDPEPLIPRRLPDQAGVALWLVQGPGSAEERAALRGLQSPDEQARHARFRVEHARDDFTISRGMLRRLLGAELDRDPASLRFGLGAHGKPFLEGDASGLEFNVSHSGSLFLYAIHRGGPLGVDVERMNPELDLDALAQRFFAPGEATRLLGCTEGAGRIQGFYRCWTRKEAYLKAKGRGLAIPLDAFEVTFLPEEEPSLLLTEVAGEDPAGWQVSEVAVPDGYAAALVRRA